MEQAKVKKEVVKIRSVIVNGDNISTIRKLYNIYTQIVHRCTNVRNKEYKEYGGRGITICENWLYENRKESFVNFYNWSIDNGYKEDIGLSIDRIDNDCGYYPENCRWADKTTQVYNRRLDKRNQTGYTGIKKIKNAYKASISKNNEFIYLGTFHKLEDAVEVRRQAEIDLYGVCKIETGA